MMLRKRAQTVSFDALVGTGAFLLVLIFLFYIMGRELGGKEAVNVQKESEKIAGILASPQNTTVSIASGTKVDASKLEDVSQIEYELLRAHFGIKSDFCIYFEDEQGKIIPVSGNRLGIGSPLVNISGVPCNGTLSS